MQNPTSTPLRIVIIGGVAGGASAATRARRCNANAEITILEKGPAVSFANCGLPYHLGGEIEDREKLIVATPELFWDRFRIRVRTGHEVTKIDREAATVTGKNSTQEEFKVPYDRLILATGSEPIRPEFCNIQADNVFQLWTLDDMDRILAYMKKRPCKKATVIGGGFIGLEVVEQLQHRQISIALIEKLPQVLGPLDWEMAKLIELELEKQKVQLHLGATVESLLTSNQRVTAVKLTNGSSVTSDLVIVGAGVRPRTALAESAGLSLGEQGGVRINEFCQTDDPNIYAVGDMVEYHHGTLDRNLRVPLAGPANRAGRVAGTHAATGHAQPLGSVQGTAIVRVFGLAAGATGINERMCGQFDIDCRTATIQAPHHANYFPGARSLTIKLIYRATDGKVLGAQAVGAEGVDKRIDVIATLLNFHGTVYDLAQLDLAYAPPFGSAKDPIHMAAFAAQNDLEKAPALLPFNADLAGLQVVDVRNNAELAKLPLDGAIHIPVDELAERWQELDPTLPTVTVCHSGKRAHVAACWLNGKGFQQPVLNLNGGMSIRKLSTTLP
ncbi:FAD-dependent oxidoreductase [Aureliella helgolandensis]|uniref:Coenzyme A disulfide reductase n=1 Tax=Aureliella helgolandensis TaxID=2527968 RepID=A0A518GHA2_9BACT|nr:FAD-dependent oxidoreductase [Aureliella helgolandensis]QDV27975.1 Coenzyme A disulfide reductase [Aureliella helgolandensis]